MEEERIRRRRKWKSLKERLALIGCCASPRGFRASDPAAAAAPAINDDEEDFRVRLNYHHEEEGDDDDDYAMTDAEEEKDLAAAAAAAGELEEQEEEGEEKGGEGWCLWLCCVCMAQPKGAAFIPCGHTFCRVCVRELWVNSGACPLCNRSIYDILDIF